MLDGAATLTVFQHLGQIHYGEKELALVLKSVTSEARVSVTPQASSQIPHLRIGSLKCILL